MIKPWGNITYLIAGDNVTIEDPSGPEPTISSEGGGGGGVNSVVAGTSIAVDSTDPANPIVSVTGETGGVASLSGPGITASPGGLTQSGGLTVSDVEGDGINLVSSSNVELSANGAEGSVVITAGGELSTVNIGQGANGATAVAENAPTYPVTIVTGTNDEFVYTPISTSIPVTYTLAGDVYNIPEELASAMELSTAPDSTQFAAHYNVAPATGISGGGYLYINSPASGTENVGDTISTGANDALASLGFASPTTTVFNGGDALGFFGAPGITLPAAIAAPTGGTIVDVQARAAITSLLDLLSAASSGYGLTA